MTARGGETRGKIGGFPIDWLSPPRGTAGSARARLSDGRVIDVHWRRDADGLWLELPGGIYGFDLEGDVGEDGRLTYTVTQRGGAGEWAGLTFARAGEESASASRGCAKKGSRVRAQMPGKILRVLVKPGASVQAGQALLVMEAMKMENEIKAQLSGRVKEIKVTEGQAVETGAELLSLEAE